MSILVFSIGPVQGFIAQSRRTADGWVGSYLLSYFVGHAIARLKDKDVDGVKVIEPCVEGVPMYDAIQAGRGVFRGAMNGDTTIAALPNTIVLETDNSFADIGEKARTAIEDAWTAVHEDIWQRLPGTMQHDFVYKIWQRQVSDCWEFYWAGGNNSKEAFNNLAARKGLRSFSQVDEDERGDRCTVCSQRQALWNEGEPRRENRRAGDAARGFWTTCAAEINGGDAPSRLIHPDGSERLCAICLTKRLIPWWPNPIRKIWSGKGVSSIPSAFPSTSTMATVIYRVELIKAAASDPDIRINLENYFGAVTRLRPKFHPVEFFECWRQVAEEVALSEWSNVDRILRLDGDWYLYGDAIKKELNLTLTEDQEIRGKYAAVLAAARRAKVKAPPIYYALLTMDGDKMGDFIEQIAGMAIDTGDISEILNEFAQNVPTVIRRYEGRTIFAGGDDVLAFLPLETALSAADELRLDFHSRFEDWGKKQSNNTVRDLAGKKTLSGSIVYAHHQAPLSSVLKAGHDLLKNWAKAKEKADRNALAMQEVQRGGPTITFAAKWCDGDGQPLKEKMEYAIEKLKTRELSMGFGHRLREIAWLFGANGPLGDLNDEQVNNDRIDYLTSIFVKSRLAEDRGADAKRESARELAKGMLAVCQHAFGENVSVGMAFEPLLMARFLAGGGREER